MYNLAIAIVLCYDDHGTFGREDFEGPASLKQQLKARSYQEIIQILLSQRQRLPASLFGVAKGSKPYSHEKEAEYAL